MKRLAILGSGDLGQLIAHHSINDHHYKVVGYFDDYQTLGTEFLDIPVIGKFEDVMRYYEAGKFDCLMIGVGYKHMNARKDLYIKYSPVIPFANIVHSSSYVDVSVKLGTGIFILPGCTVDKHVQLGNNVLLNAAAVVAHDTVVMDHTFIAPAASIAGKTTIKSCCFIGINSTVIDNITIEEFIVVAGGAVVTADLIDKGLYAGIPAKLIRQK